MPKPPVQPQQRQLNLATQSTTAHGFSPEESFYMSPEPTTLHDWVRSTSRAIMASNSPALLHQTTVVRQTTFMRHTTVKRASPILMHCMELIQKYFKTFKPLVPDFEMNPIVNTVKQFTYDIHRLLMIPEEDIVKKEQAKGRVFTNDPSKIQIAKDKLILVLDIDETIAHASVSEANRKFRSFLGLLGAFGHENIEVVIWSAGSPGHVSTILDDIDPQATIIKKAIYRKYRAGTTAINWHAVSKTIPATELYLYDNIKNLELLPNCEGRAILVDNSPAAIYSPEFHLASQNAALNNKASAIPVPDFLGNPDHILLNVFLIVIATYLEFQAAPMRTVKEILAQLAYGDRTKPTVLKWLDKDRVDYSIIDGIAPTLVNTINREITAYNAAARSSIWSSTSTAESTPQQIPSSADKSFLSLQFIPPECLSWLAPTEPSTPVELVEQTIASQSSSHPVTSAKAATLQASDNLFAAVTPHSSKRCRSSSAGSCNSDSCASDADIRVQEKATSLSFRASSRTLSREAGKTLDAPHTKCRRSSSISSCGGQSCVSDLEIGPIHDNGLWQRSERGDSRRAISLGFDTSSFSDMEVHLDELSDDEELSGQGHEAPRIPITNLFSIQSEATTRDAAEKPKPQMSDEVRMMYS